MALATPYPDRSNRAEEGPCLDDLRPAQGFTPVLVYARVFGVGFHVFIVPYGSILQQNAAVPLPNARQDVRRTCKLPRSTYWKSVSAVT
jgi:hypothetical protein